MTTPTVTPLTEKHSATHFSSGALELDSWLRDHALTAQQRDTSRTYVIADEAGAVQGYLALVVGVVANRDLPSRAGRGLPGEVPAVLLAKLAVDGTAQGSGLGKALIAHALRTSLEVRERAAARLLLVQARDTTAVDWYLRMGFRRLREELALHVRLKDLTG